MLVVLSPEDWRSVTGFERLIFLALRIRNIPHQPQAAVPAKYGIVVAGRTDLFSFLEVPHGSLEVGYHALRKMARLHLRLRMTLVENAKVVSSLIRARKPLEV